MAHKIGILVVAYCAEKTIAELIDRIPAPIKKTAETYILDDCSPDNTYKLALAHVKKNNLRNFSVFKNEKNLRYGGNQKRGYEYALKQGFDFVVLLHGDLQYPPEKIPELLAPLVEKKADAVFGSRMLGHPLNNGMPLWRFLGNKVLTVIENFVLGMHLSEFHSGFRAYSCNSLRKLPLRLNTNEFYFDTETIIQLHNKKFRIVEIPIPTNYGKDSRSISFSEVIYYGLSILRELLIYELHKAKLLKVKKYE